ncbi:MAG: translation initiation factor IF-6 [Candidatus Methanomethylicia archaeon]
MGLYLTDFHGNPNIGVYVFANDKFAIVPKGTDRKFINLLKENLKVKEIISTNIAGITVIGAMVSGNENFLILPYNVLEDEVQAIKKALNVDIIILPSKKTAVGNIVLVDEKKALVHSSLEDEAIKIIEDNMDVEVFKGSVAMSPLIGSSIVMNKHGILANPNITPNERRNIEDIFKKTVNTGTVNHGFQFVRTGIIANSYGALVGNKTTGSEIMKITATLKV